MTYKSALEILEKTKTPENEAALAYIRAEVDNALIVLDGTSASEYQRFTGSPIERCLRLYRFVQEIVPE